MHPFLKGPSSSFYKFSETQPRQETPPPLYEVGNPGSATGILYKMKSNLSKLKCNCANEKSHITTSVDNTCRESITCCVRVLNCRSYTLCNVNA